MRLQICCDDVYLNTIASHTKQRNNRHYRRIISEIYTYRNVIYAQAVVACKLIAPNIPCCAKHKQQQILAHNHQNGVPKHRLYLVDAHRKISVRGDHLVTRGVQQTRTHIEHDARLEIVLPPQK